MKKKGNKKMPTPARQEVIGNPISTSLFLSYIATCNMHSSVLSRYLTYNLRINGKTFEVNVYLQELILKMKSTKVQTLGAYSA